MKASALVVIQGGVAEIYKPRHVDVRVVDLDNIKAGDGPVELPAGMGFEDLCRRAGLPRNDTVKFTTKRSHHHAHTSTHSA